MIASSDGCCVGAVAVQLPLDTGEFGGDAGLFFFEQVEGDGAGVVGVQEAAAFVFEVGAAGGQGADVVLAVGFDVV